MTCAAAAFERSMVAEPDRRREIFRARSAAAARCAADLHRRRKSAPRRRLQRTSCAHERGNIDHTTRERGPHEAYRPPVPRQQLQLCAGTEHERQRQGGVRPNCLRRAAAGVGEFVITPEMTNHRGRRALALLGGRGLPISGHGAAN